MEYTYSSIPSAPGAANIHIDVAASSMTDKTIEGCTWHEDIEELKVKFTGTLSGGDKTILDGIVTDNT